MDYIYRVAQPNLIPYGRRSSSTLSTFISSFEDTPATLSFELMIMTYESPTKLVELWMDNLCLRDIDRIVSFYHKNAILIPTLSKEIRQGEFEIRDYFVDFVGNHPNLCGEIVFDLCQEVGSNDVVISGVYTFTWGEDEEDELAARFTYVFTLAPDDNWKILTHHSSQIPETKPSTVGILC